MSLVLCSSAEKYTAGKNNHEQPCFDSATKASVEADAKVGTLFQF